MIWAREPYRIWIGYDGSESRAYDIAVKSLIRRTSAKVNIYPLRQDWLRSIGLYTRTRDPLASTEFSFTRFLTPALAGYSGPALFVDADFLFLADIKELFDLYDPFFALQCVKHIHHPTESTKMNGAIQTQYPRKNWSSLILWNTGHPAVKENLTPHEVNQRPGSWLHQFQWCQDLFIGELPMEWNAIEGHNDLNKAKAIHFSRGVPTIHGGTFDSEDLWLEELQAVNK